MSEAETVETPKAYGLERMLFFSDAVIAIMLTLLAIELPVPEAADPSHLWAALSEHGAHYVAFIVSFAVIAPAWIAHHLFFTYVSRSDAPLITLNLLVLFGYVLIPWASKTLGDVPNSVGVIVLSAAMTFLSGAMYLLVRHTVRAGLVHETAPPAVISGIRAWTAGTTILFLFSIPIALLIGRWTILVWAVGYLALRGFVEYQNRRSPTSAR
jgi:uncharacterized membrane protein